MPAGVCLSVSNFTLKETIERICTKILPQMYLWTRKKLHFGSHPLPDPDPGIFLNDSSTLRDRAFFHNSAHISAQSDRIFVEILPRI